MPKVTAGAGEFGVCMEKISWELRWGLHHVSYKLFGWMALKFILSSISVKSFLKYLNYMLH